MKLASPRNVVDPVHIPHDRRNGRSHFSPDALFAAFTSITVPIAGGSSKWVCLVKTPSANTIANSNGDGHFCSVSITRATVQMVRSSTPRTHVGVSKDSPDPR